MENFQRSSAPPNIKYNCVVLFLSQLYLLFIYASKYKPDRIFWSPCKRKKAKYSGKGRVNVTDEISLTLSQLENTDQKNPWFTFQFQRIILTHLMLSPQYVAYPKCSLSFIVTSKYFLLLLIFQPIEVAIFLIKFFRPLTQTSLLPSHIKLLLHTRT